MKTLIAVLLLSSSFAHAARFVVEAKRPLTTKELKASGLAIQKFADPKHLSPYFSRLYTVTTEQAKEDLEKLSWVSKVEETVELTYLSLLPSPNPVRLVTDELFPFQWSLLNQGQSYVKEKDDIHNIPLPGLNGKDVNWRSVYQNIPEGRPIVAVLDSGVDLDHPDLQGNLWRNEKECGKDHKADNDGNKFPGDCAGWNFTEPKDSDEAKSPQDMDGHGTHVAGIIAAANNGIGIVGANPNALIMPIKVMKDADSRSQVAASESFALGIIYATDMGAHIINLSLGWPRSLETSHLRNAINYALNQNVIIVAAAGNNNSAEPLFPCAYDGVICTAASTLDGNYAGFSNYGGHVDAVTPGEGILSLNPVIYEPDFFSIPGYDIKSGTSQSAPLLSGLISILKAQKPRLTIDEVFARLYQATPNSDKKKYTLGGDVTWHVLNREVTGPVVRPILKRVRQIVLQGENTDARLNIPVRNYGLETHSVEVKLESLSQGLEILNPLQTIELLRPSEFKTVPFMVRITDFSMESNVRFKVTVTSSEGELSFLNEIPVSRDVKGEAAFRKLPFTFAKNPLPFGSVENGKLITFLNTLEGYGKSDRQDFFLRRTIKTENKLVLTIFGRKANALVEAPAPITLENFSALVNFLRIDLNFDGKEDYLVQYIDEVKNEKNLVFAFYDENMNPLWRGFQHVKVKIDLVIENITDLNFIRLDHPALGKMMVPTFFTKGQLPKLDQKQDFYGRWDVSKEDRLYYLEPQFPDMSFRIRALTSQSWIESVKKELNSKWFENVLVENMLPVSVSDAAQGRVRVILSVGQGTKRQIFISSFDTKSTSRGKALPQMVIQTEEVDPLYSVTATGLDVVGESYLNVYDRTRSKIVNTKDQTQSFQLNYTHEAETDLIIGQIASFEKGSDKFSVLQTRDELVSLSTVDNKLVKTSRPKLRYSFFSAKVLSEMYVPVIYKRGTEQAPALYVDSTAVTANRVYLFEQQNGRLVSSVRNSLIVPVENAIACKAMNPSFSATTQAHEFTFLCLENKEWFLRTYPMK